MKKPIYLVLSVLSMIAIAEGCAKPVATSNKTKASTAIAPANIKAAPGTPAGSPQTAKLVTDVSFYYGYYAIHNADNFNAMLTDDGGCQLATDFTNAIGGTDLTNSTTAFASSLQGQPGVNSAQASADAQRILSDIQQLTKLCTANGADDPYAYGDESIARDLLAASQTYRTDLGLVNPK